MTSAFTSRLDGAVTGLAIKAPVKVATTTNITLSGAQTIDGVAVTAGDRVLVKAQTTTSENGIYTAAATSWTRSADFSGERDVAQGTVVRVVSGTVHADQWWQVATASPVIGSALTFSQVSDTLLAGFNQVTDWGAVGDGATDDTAALTAAVAAASAGGFDLHWPAGAYLTTASIPLLHSVRHRGRGRIVRGLDTFYVEPRTGQSNTLYIAATATSGNDGLSSSQAIGINTDNWDALEDALANYGPTLEGSWTITGAAGTYRGGYVHPRNLASRDIIDFAGPAAGHPNVPTMIIDDATASETRGMLFQDGAIVRLTDIKFTGAFAECASAVRDCYIWFVNVHCGADGASNYPAIGLAMETRTHYFVAGGLIDGCTDIGISELFGVVRSFSTGISLAIDQMTIQNCAVGVKAKENCVGHLRYLNIDNCDTGVELQAYSAANVSNMEIGNCAVGIVLTNSQIHNETSIVWNTGNTVKILPFGQAASQLATLGWVANSGDPAQRVGYPAPISFANDYDSDTHTGTTNITAIWTELDILPAGYYSVKGRRFEVLVVGRVPTGVTLIGDVTIYLYVEGLQEASVVIPSGSGQQGWTARFSMVCPSDGNAQIYSATLVGETFQYAYTIRRTRDLASQDNAVAIRVGLANAADSITLDVKELFA